MKNCRWKIKCVEEQARRIESTANVVQRTKNMANDGMQSLQRNARDQNSSPRRESELKKLMESLEQLDSQLEKNEAQIRRGKERWTLLHVRTLHSFSYVFLQWSCIFTVEKWMMRDACVFMLVRVSLTSQAGQPRDDLRQGKVKTNRRYLRQEMFALLL